MGGPSLKAVRQSLKTALVYYRLVRHERPLYYDQVEWALACERAVHAARRRDMDVPRALLLVAARQTGKNEVDAEFAVRMLLYFGALGARVRAIKSAPTWKPQIALSEDRLKRALDDNPLSRGKWDTEKGYIYVLNTAKMVFMSAQERASRHGETADLYQTIDECQHTSKTVYSQDFAPMRSSTGAPVFFMGTRWTEDCLLEDQMQFLLDLEKRDKRKRVWVVPWWVRAEQNPAYGKFVESEIERLGENHPIIQGQYCCNVVKFGDRLLTDADIDKMIGDHQRGQRVNQNAMLVGGVDYCGVDETATVDDVMDLDRMQKRDSTVGWVAELSWDSTEPEEGKPPVHIPRLTVIDLLFLPGLRPEESLSRVFNFFFEKHRCIKVVADAQGVGDYPSAQLEQRRHGMVERLKSSAADVSRLGYRLLAAINTGRFKLYRDDNSPEYAEIIFQFRQLRKRKRDNGLMWWGHPEQTVAGKKVHDDGPRAAAYTVEAGFAHLAGMSAPYVERKYEPWDEAAGYGDSFL